MTDMYGINSNVNFPPGYGYGKTSQPQQPQVGSHRIADENSTGKTDQILFSAVERKEDSSLDSLSDTAKAYLEELKEKYKGYDFIIADYSTDEEASKLLSEGNGEINVLITPDLLEKMAADESTREKYESIISGASDTFDEISENLTDAGKALIKSFGISVNEDGTVDYFANLIKGVTAEDGSKTVRSSLISGMTDVLNALAESLQERINGDSDDKTPIISREKAESNLPPKSYEKLEKKENPYSTEEDYGTMPPKSFQKYQKKDDPYATEEDYGTMPPKSFQKYQKEDDPYATEEDYGTLPPESFKKYQKDDVQEAQEMNFKA